MNNDWLPVFIGVWLLVGLLMFRPRTDSVYTRAHFRRLRREKAERYRKYIENALRERNRP